MAAVIRAPLGAVFLGVVALAIVLESLLLFPGADGGLAAEPDGSTHTHGRQCAALRDCGGFHHRFALAALWLAATYLWLRKDVDNAAHVSKSLFWLVVLLLGARHVLRVQPGATVPTLKAAYVISIDGQHWKRLSAVLAASFPQAEIPVRLLPGVVGPEPPNAMGAVKRDITSAHISALEAISRAEDTALRDARSAAKEWYLVLEEDAALTTASSRGAGLPGGWPLVAPEALAATLQGLLAKLPKRAQAVNLG
jgi:hypothetical protein